ncbi:hypothetical protein [Herminiimonas sp. CN]|uniref:hypothetical protein n=1 Tax=Herminiimonas sp. CN TaxID=1349818 RepID=UPI0012DE223A|nr:hypothetical protein [Herminiimonas sp. CN]
MALVRVFGNTYLNPASVGKVEHTPKFNDGASRTNTTTVFDTTGQHILLKVETTVPTPAPQHDPKAVVRDNHVHSEIINALHEGQHAMPFAEE